VIGARTLLPEMVAIPSRSGEERALAEYLVGRMHELGFDARVDEAGNAVGVKRGAEVPGGVAERQVVLLGHLDTVPGDIPVRLEGDVLHGRGAVDAKGPLATFVLAAARVRPAPGVALTVIGAVEEEIHTSKGARHVAPLFRPEACLIGEPSGFDALTLGYKGSLNLDFALTQPGGHGAGPQGAVAERAVRVWNGIRAWADAFDAGEERLFQRLMPSLARIATRSDGLHDVVEATFGFRLPPGFDTRALVEHVRSLEPAATLAVRGDEPAWTSERTSPLARAFTRAFAKHDLKLRFKHKTGTSDMNVLGPAWGCPIAAYGPGDSTLDHTPEERVDLREVERSIDILADVLVQGGWATAAG